MVQEKHTVKFSAGKLNDHIEIAGRLSNIYSDGYVDRAFSDLKSYFLQGSYTDDNTLIKALVFGGKEQTYQAWFGLTSDELKEDRRQNPYTYDNETDNYQQDHYQLHWNEKLNKNWSTTLGLNYTQGSGYFEQFKSGKKPEDYADLVVETDGSRTDLIVRRWLENDFYVANFNANYTSENLKIISGISYSNYTGDHFGEVIWAKQFADDASIRDRYYESDATKNDFSIFSKATFNLSEKLKTYIDLQGRFVNYKTIGLTSDRIPIDVISDFSFFNPKVGFTYRLNDNNSLYTSYSRANREPNRKDFELNINVKSEKMNDYELGWRLRTDNIKLNTNIYYMQYKDQLILTGDIDDTGDYTRENVDDSYRLGLEIDADIQLNDKISIRPNFSLSSNKIKDISINRDNSTTFLGDSEIAFSPSMVAGNAFVYSPSDKFQLALLSKFVGEQYLSNTETVASKLESYFTSDFNVSYELETNSIFKSIVLLDL